MYRVGRKVERVEEWETDHGIRSTTFKGSSLQVSPIIYSFIWKKILLKFKPSAKPFAQICTVNLT